MLVIMFFHADKYKKICDTLLRCTRNIEIINSQKTIERIIENKKMG